MDRSSSIVRQARERAGLSQRALAERAGTSQPAVARVESGRSTVTVATLRRLLAAAGFDLVMTLATQREQDPVTAAYRRDVDRTLLRENRRRTVDERLRSGADLADAVREIQRATRAVGRSRRRPR